MSGNGKWKFLTIILALIAFIEGMFVLYDMWRPSKTDFDLASAEIAVPAREVKIPPLLFEEQASQKVADDLDLFIKDKVHEDNLLQKISRQLVEKKPITEQNAVINKSGKKYIAIVIDDMGISPQYTKEIIAIKKPMTASFLPYAPANKKQVQEAIDAGFEVMLHVPMMPHHRASLAPHTLAPQMDKATVQKYMNEYLAYFANDKIRGANNHMGSEFTENSDGMSYVMEILKANDMFFLDSKTTGKSVAEQVAKKYGVTYIGRDVFLDNENDYEYIMGQLKQAENVAAKHGQAVAIGHPHNQTVRALSDWVKDVENRGFKLVHISDLLKK